MPRIKISQAAKEFNVSIPTVVEQLQKKGISIDANPNTRIDEAAYDILVEAFQPDRKVRELIEKKRHDKEAEKSSPASQDEVKIAAPSPGIEFKVLGKIDLDANNNAVKEKAPAREAAAPAPAPAAKAETPKEEKKPEAPAPVKAEAPKEEKKPEAQAEPATASAEPEVFRYSPEPQLTGPKVLGHIDLTSLNQSTRPKKKTKEERRNSRNGQAGAQGAQGGQGAQGSNNNRKKRQRIGGKEKIDIEKAGKQNPEGGNRSGQGGGGNHQGGQGGNNRGGNDRGRGKDRNKRPVHAEVNEEDVQKQVRETLARLTSKDKGQKKGAKWRKEKREAFANRANEAAAEAAAESREIGRASCRERV